MLEYYQFSVMLGLVRNGDHCLTTLAIAGWRVRLDCNLPAVDEAIAACYAAFVVDDAATSDATATVTVSSPIIGAVPGELSPQMRVTYCGDEVLLDVPGACGKIVVNSWQAWLELSSDAFYPNLEYFLRILCALLAYRTGGLLVHAAGLLVGGQVHLFIGHSGSGKSTVVALSSQALALGDDLILLRPEETGWRAYGTPFWNPEATRREGQSASGILAGIYSLVQDREVYLQTLSPAAATAELAANCPVVSGDVAQLSGLLGRCQQLGAEVPVHRLHFRKDPGFWGLLRGGPGAVREGSL
jgi:hypothetical protein